MHRPHRTFVTTALGLGTAALLAACGGGTTKTVTVPSAAQASTSAAQASTSAGKTQSGDIAVPSPTGGTQAPGTLATTSATITQSSPTPGAGGPPTTIVRLASFRSPTGNIGCMIIGGTARCDIVKRNWSPPPRPASCPNIVDFGQGLEVGTSGTGRFVCAGDTARDPTAPVLGYGSGSLVGHFICVSRTTGMTCTNRFTGHGFAIAIGGYEIF